MNLLDLIGLDQNRMALARSRQTAVLRGDKPDKYPIFARAPLTAAQNAGIPNPNFKEAFYDQEQMLFSETRAACAVINAGSDAVPSIRSNLGTGILLSCLGLEQEIYPDKMPWLTQHLTKQEIMKLEPDDIRIQGSFARGIEQMKFFMQETRGQLPIYCMDTQGPFDLAHLLLGEDIFLELHDDPPFVRHMMELCLELGIRTHTWMKDVIGEPANAMHLRNCNYFEGVGIRICEDTTSLVSKESIMEFALPYSIRLARAFGGAYVHYCGRNDNLTELICATPEFRGINLGHIPNHVFDHPFDDEMRKCLAAGKVYVGDWPRYPSESGKQFLDRMHFWAKQGCLIPNANPAVGKDGFSTIMEALDYWYSL